MLNTLLALVVLVLPQEPHALERATGWRALFDGATSAGWIAHGGDAFPAEGWEIVDGCLHKLPDVAGGDLVARELFGDFELEFEWRVAPGANSGFKYRVPPADAPQAMLGPEYQLLDDEAHAGEDPKHTSGALYALYAPEGAALAPPAEFNASRVVARGNAIEHWLNGVRVVACEVGSDDWQARKAASKFASVEDFAAPRPGRVGFQDHGGEAWIKNVRVRELAALGEPIALFADGTLDGWIEVGDARWTPNEDGVLGETGGGGQSFLVTERTFGDFVLELELRNELPGNSGVQVRSRRNARGQVQGYQIEVDPSERAWSGGLYDEARRGWLDDLADEPAARAAFAPGEWNRYRIECIGPWIRTWVNGVPAADAFDPLDLEGILGLQVHSGNDTRVRWRHLRVWDLGTRAWEPVARSANGDFAFPAELADFALRLRFDAVEQPVRIAFRCDAEQPSHEHGPGLTADEHGWTFELAHAELAGPATLTLCVFGERASVHQDGKRLAEARFPDARRSGRLVLGEGVRWTSAELLSEAR